MTGPVELERYYRRLLRYYPKDFRREYEQELLGVLLAGAQRGQLRPTLGEGLNLMLSGVWTRLRPTVPRSARTVLVAVRLMYLGALLEIAGLIVLLTTASTLRSGLFRLVPSFTHAQWHGVVVPLLAVHVIAGSLAVLFWLWMAWANGRGHEWARRTFAAFWGLMTVIVLGSLIQYLGVLDPAALAMGVLLWSFEFAVVILIFTERSNPYYWRKRERIGAVSVSHPADPRSA